MTIITDDFTISTWGVEEDIGDGITWQLWSVRVKGERIGFIALPIEMTTEEILAHSFLTGVGR